MQLKPVARQDLLSVGIPKVINGAASFSVSLILARVFEPVEYGLVSFCLTYLMLIDGLLGAAMDLGVTGRITAAPLGPEIHPLEAAGIAWKLVVGAVTWFLLAVGGNWIGERFFLDATAGRTLQLWAVAATMMLLLRSLQLYLQTRSLFGWYGTADFTHTLLRLSFLGIGASTGLLSPAWIMAAYAAAGAIVVSAACVVLRARLKWQISAPSRTTMADAGLASVPALLTFGLSVIVSRMDTFFVLLLAGPADLGIYSVALTVAMIPEIAGSYISPALLPRIQPACRAGAIGALLGQVNRWVFLACAAAIAGGFLAAPYALLFLGPNYARSSELVPVLLVGTIAISSIFPMTLNFLLLHDSRAALRTDLWALPILAAAYWILIPVYGILAAAYLMAGYRVLRAVYLQIRATRLARRMSGQPEMA